MNAFENETFEGLDEVNPELSAGTAAYDMAQAALHEQRLASVGLGLVPAFVPAFDEETGEVTEEKGARFLRNVERVGELDATVLASSKTPSKRVKRTEAQMVASFGGNAMRESVYVLERLSKLEDKMSELLNSVGVKTQAMIISERPELSRFRK